MRFLFKEQKKLFYKYSKKNRNWILGIEKIRYEGSD